MSSIPQKPASPSTDDPAQDQAEHNGIAVDTAPDNQIDDTLASPTPMPGTSRVPVSVVILTLNEEINIAQCLASCAWCDDVHVLDSGSTDRTREIAEEKGATVHINPFESCGAQRNWAIDNIPTKYNWIFHLDADEQFTE